MAAQFQFVMRSGPNVGKIYPLEAAEIIIGRDNNVSIPINDAEISRKHAKLELHGSAYVIQDLGSTNGTFVNGQRLTAPVALNPNDSVSFGENIVFSFEAAFDPNATMLSSKAAKTAAPMQRPAPIQAAPAPAVAPAPMPVRPPAYSGQVPVGPVPMAAPAKKSSSKTIIIILVVVLVCLILACVALLVWVDADKTGGRWCMFPFSLIAKMLGAVCK
jgi:predicted component of type VI protein secretion system